VLSYKCREREMIISHILFEQRSQAHTKRERGTKSSSAFIQVQRERKDRITHLILIKNAGTHEDRETERERERERERCKNSRGNTRDDTCESVTLYSQKSPISPQKSHVFPQKSPTFLPKEQYKHNQGNTRNDTWE